MNTSHPVATVSVDLDNLWCYQKSMGDKHWQRFESCLHVAVPRLLALLAKHQIQATFFVVAKDTEASEHQALWQAIRQAGHEIASHAYYHDMAMPSWPSTDIERELKKAHQAIENHCGQAPIGFRAPAFGVNEDMLKALVRLGYRYDASEFFSSTGVLARWYHRIHGKDPQQGKIASGYGLLHTAWQPQGARKQVTTGGTLWRLPVSTIPVLRTPFHGTYLHYLAQFGAALARGYLSLAMTLCRWRNVAPSFLLHPTDVLGKGEFDALAALPGMAQPAEQKWALTDDILSRLSQRYTLLTHAQYCDHLEQHHKASRT